VEGLRFPLNLPEHLLHTLAGCGIGYTQLFLYLFEITVGRQEEIEHLPCFTLQRTDGTALEIPGDLGLTSRALQLDDSQATAAGGAAWRKTVTTHHDTS
jgi:hypothetical protein